MKNSEMIRQFKAENVPASVMKVVNVVAAYVLVVPLEYFETVLSALKYRRVEYKVYYRKNDFVIATLLKGE